MPVRFVVDPAKSTSGGLVSEVGCVPERDIGKLKALLWFAARQSKRGEADMKPVFAAVVAGAIALAVPALAEDKLVAIDVLLEPDQLMLSAAEEWNKRLREQLPDGFSLGVDKLTVYRLGNFGTAAEPLGQ
jgi:hypothetical protein